MVHRNLVRFLQVTWRRYDMATTTAVRKTRTLRAERNVQHLRSQIAERAGDVLSSASCWIAQLRFRHIAGGNPNRLMQNTACSCFCDE